MIFFLLQLLPSAKYDFCAPTPQHEIVDPTQYISSMYFDNIYFRDFHDKGSSHGRTKGGIGGSCPLANIFFWKKVNFWKNLVFLGKNWDFATMNFFFIFPPLKSVLGTLLALAPPPRIFL